MKKIICMIYAGFVFSAGLSAQTTETIRLKGQEAQDFIAKEEFRYPEFRTGRVYFNNGDSAGATFNYNFLVEKMLFINTKGDTVEMVNENTISHITVGKDTYYYYANDYYQQLPGSGTCRLVIKQKLKIVGDELVGAYGVASPTNKIYAVDGFMDMHTHKLSLNEEMTFAKQKTFFLMDAKGNFVTANEKNFAKLFPAKKQAGKNYIAQNKLNLDDEEDLEKLCVFLNSPG